MVRKEIISRTQSAIAFAALATISALLLWGQAIDAQAAEAWPTKSITFVVTAGAGGGSDVAGRVMAKYLAEELKVAVNVVNKPGGNNVPAILSVTDVAPDGYTWMLENPSNSTILLTDKNIPLKIEDRTYLPMMITGPTTYVVSTKSSITSMKDLIAQTKKDPSSITWYRAGAGIAYMSMIQLFKVAGVDPAKTKAVDFDSGTAGNTAVAGGHVLLGGGGPGGVLALVRSGNLRVLAITGDKRIQAMPDVPTAKELGLELNMMNWFSISAAKALPKAVVDRIDDAAKKVTSNPEYAKAIEAQGSYSFYKSSAETRDYVMKEFNVMKQMTQ